MAFSGAAILPTPMSVALEAFWTGETIGGTRVYTPLGYRVTCGLAALAGLLPVRAAIGLHRRAAADASR